MATPQDSMLAGLFTTPEQYQQQRQAVQRAQAIQMASLDPFQQGQANIQMGFNRLADVGAGALGIQDPQLQQLSTINQLASQFDTGTSGGMAAFANALRERQLYGPAAQLAAQVAPLRLKEAEAQAKTAERLTNEQKNATAIADSAGLQRGTSEWTDKYNTELARLTAGSKGANIKEIGVAEKTREPVYFDVTTDSQFVVKKDPNDPTKQIRVPFNGGVDRTTANIGVNPSLSLVDKESNLRKDFTTETKPLTTIITTADRIDRLLTGNTSLGEVIARKQFAKLAGDTNISNRDVADLANFGDLGQRLSGILSGFFEGKYSEAQRQEALGLVKQLKAESSNQYMTVQKQYRDRAAAENIPEKTSQFIAPNLPVAQKAALPPEGTRLRNKKTGKIEVVRNGKLVPE